MIRRGFPIVLIGYGVVVNAYLAAYLTQHNSIPVIAQMNHIAHWMTLGGMIGALAAAFSRRYRLLGLWLLPAATAFLIWYGAAFIPHKPASAEGTKLTVATYNTLRNNRHWEEVIVTIESMDADIIALQEVSPRLRRVIGDELAEEYPYQAFFMMQSFEMNGILSRYPILEQEQHQDDFTRIQTDEPRFLRVVVGIDGARLVVYNFHPFRPRFSFLTRYDDHLNRQNYTRLLEKLQTETEPVLVLCDCNATPRTDQYSWMDKRLDEIQAAVGWGLGLTHPGLPITWLPIRNIRLDYIWYSPLLVPLETQVGESQGGSDHYPLYGRLVLPSDSGMSS
jgi:endonuclease/exonuclease/phosphatase (EEP) superfamily protein YafD